MFKNYIFLLTTYQIIRIVNCYLYIIIFYEQSQDLFKHYYNEKPHDSIAFESREVFPTYRVEYSLIEKIKMVLNWNSFLSF